MVNNRPQRSPITLVIFAGASSSANASGSNAIGAGASSSASASNTTIRQVEADEAGDQDGSAFIFLIMRTNWW